MNAFLRYPAIALIAGLVSACAGTQVAPLYEGEPRAEEELLVVELPPRIKLFSINDQEVEIETPMFGGNDRELHLEPGRYRIVVYYQQLWEKRTGEHATLMSDAVVLPLEGNAGSRWRVDYPRPGNFREAEALAETFTPWLEDSETGERIAAESSRVELQRGILASSRPSARNREIRPADTVTPQGTEEETTTQEAPETDEEPAYLDLLKAYWSQATEEERREFLRWISQ